MTESSVMTDTPSTPGDELLTPQQAASLLGVTADTVRRWANERVIPSVRTRPGGHRRFRRSDVQTLIEQTRATAS